MGTLYCTVFSSYNLDIKMRVAPRTPKTFNPETGWTNNDTEQRDLVTKHTSKKGFHSLIYNPVISMAIDVRDINGVKNIGVPVGSIHKFATVMASVYKGLSTPNLYAKGADGSYVMDKTIAMKLASKFPIYSGYVTIAPCVTRMNGRDAGAGAGVSISSDDGVTGTIPHTDIVAIYTALNNLDINTYSMLATLLSKMVDVEDKVDRLEAIEGKVDNILRLLQSGNIGSTPKPTSPIDDGLPPWEDSPLDN